MDFAGHNITKGLIKILDECGCSVAGTLFNEGYALHHAVLQWILPIAIIPITDEGLHVAELFVTNFGEVDALIGGAILLHHDVAIPQMPAHGSGHHQFEKAGLARPILLGCQIAVMMLEFKYNTTRAFLPS